MVVEGVESHYGIGGTEHSRSLGSRDEEVVEVELLSDIVLWTVEDALTRLLSFDGPEPDVLGSERKAEGYEQGRR